MVGLVEDYYDEPEKHQMQMKHTEAVEEGLLRLSMAEDRTEMDLLRRCCEVLLAQSKITMPRGAMAGSTVTVKVEVTDAYSRPIPLPQEATEFQGILSPQFDEFGAMSSNIIFTFAPCGDGTFEATVPVPIESPGHWQVAVQLCGRHVNGSPIALEVYPAGRIPYVIGCNEYGQLGIGNSPSYSSMMREFTHKPWGNAPITSIACGYYHTLLLAGKALYSFGQNDNGQLGIGKVTETSTRQLVSGPWEGSSITAIAAGTYHSLVLAGGSLYIAGYSAHNPMLSDKGKFEQLDGPWHTTPVTHIAAGGSHTVLVAGGVLYAFGSNGYGQLGLGDTLQRVKPQRVEGPWGNSPITHIAAGGGHTVVVAGGSVYSFGWNSYGQLGLCDTRDKLMPEQVDGPWEDMPITMVSAGYYHTALLAGGALYTFGYNDCGQLGCPNMSQRPERVEGPWGKTPITLIAAGCYHTMVVAGGSLFVCGYNNKGQLGLGHTTQRTSFERVEGLRSQSKVIMVAGGYNHTLLLTQ